MVHLSQQQQLDAMPEGMAKQVALRILNAPKAPLDKLEEDCKELRVQFMKAHNLTEL